MGRRMERQKAARLSFSSNLIAFFELWIVHGKKLDRSFLLWNAQRTARFQRWFGWLLTELLLATVPVRKKALAASMNELSLLGAPCGGRLMALVISLTIFTCPVPVGGFLIIFRASSLACYNNNTTYINPN